MANAADSDGTWLEPELRTIDPSLAPLAATVEPWYNLTRPVDDPAARAVGPAGRPADYGAFAFSFGLVDVQTEHCPCVTKVPPLRSPQVPPKPALEPRQPKRLFELAINAGVQGLAH
jgi:hypothetical protein